MPSYVTSNRISRKNSRFTVDPDRLIIWRGIYSINNVEVICTVHRAGLIMDPTAFGNVRLAGFAPDLDLSGRLCGRATSTCVRGVISGVTPQSCDFTAHVCTGMILSNYKFFVSKL